MSNAEKRSYDTKAAAEYVGLSEDLLKKLRAEGQSKSGVSAIKFIKLGRCVRYLKEDLDLFLDQQPKYLTLAEHYLNTQRGGNNERTYS